MDEKDDFEITVFEEPVTIKCHVEGRNLMAEITIEYCDPTDHFFYIEFSNDVQIVAGPSTFETGRWWVDEMEYLPYLNSIEKSLADFIAVRESFWYKFEIKNGSQKLLVWVAQGEANKNEFSVHFEGDYRFHLEKINSRWISWTIGGYQLNPILQPIVDEVCAYLDGKI